MNTAPNNLVAREVAALLNSSTSYVYKLARTGKLAYLALGDDGPGHRTAMRFPAEAIAEFIRSRTVRTRPPPSPKLGPKARGEGRPPRR